MNDSFTQFLAQLNLQPGQCKLFQVNGYHLEIRRPAVEPPDFADMVMLEPWVAFPDGEPDALIPVRYEPHPLPVAPEIPSDEESTP